MAYRMARRDMYEPEYQYAYDGPEYGRGYDRSPSPPVIERVRDRNPRGRKGDKPKLFHVVHGDGRMDDVYLDDMVRGNEIDRGQIRELAAGYGWRNEYDYGPPPRRARSRTPPRMRRDSMPAYGRFRARSMTPPRIAVARVPMEDPRDIDPRDMMDPRDFIDPRDMDPRDMMDPRDFINTRDLRDPRYARDPYEIEDGPRYIVQEQAPPRRRYYDYDEESQYGYDMYPYNREPLYNYDEMRAQVHEIREKIRPQAYETWNERQTYSIPRAQKKSSPDYVVREMTAPEPRANGSYNYREQRPAYGQEGRRISRDESRLTFYRPKPAQRY